MVSSNFGRSALFGLMWGALSMTSALGATGLLEQAYAQAWGKTSTVAYAAPSVAELAVTQDLFTRLLRGEPADSLAGQARAGGWQLRSERRADGVVIVVSDIPGTARGRGLYAFFSNGRHALQAPHVPSDGLTGEILLRYAADGLPRAMAWNTVPRSRVDLAHLDGTDLIAFTRAFVQSHPRDKILQLHGYDSGRRRSASAAESGAIVSATHTNPSRELRSAVRCLREKVEPGAKLYGVDVNELGGTTNSVARAVRTGGWDQFVHVEMALPLRERLLSDHAQRAALFTCLVGQQ